MDPTMAKGESLPALHQPDESDKFALLLERLDRMEQRMEAVMEIAQQGPHMAAMFTDTVDETFRRAAMKGVDLEGRLNNLLAMLERLSSDDTSKVLTAVLDRSNQLKQTLDMFDEGPLFFAMVTDMMDEMAGKVRDSGVDLDVFVKQSIKGFERLALLVNSGEFEALLDSGVFSAEAANTVGMLGKALAQSNAESPESVGLFGMLGVMREPDVQRAMGFLTKVLRHFGRALNTSDRPALKG